MIFKNKDGSSWKYICSHSWRTFIVDWNNPDDDIPWCKRVVNDYTIKGDYRVDNKTGKFKMFDFSNFRKWRHCAIQDYEDLRDELLKHYPSCNAHVWQEDTDETIFMHS